MGLLSSVVKGASSLLGYSPESASSEDNSSSYDPWTALAQGAVNIGTGMINNAYAISAAQRDYRYAKQLIDYQNAYNLPINQRKRLEDAGLNPNYILGGISSTSASGSASGGTGGRMEPFNLLAYQNMMSQNALINAQKKEVEARASLIGTQEKNWEHDHASPYKDIADALVRIFSGNKSSASGSPGSTKPGLFWIKGKNGNPLFYKGFYDNNGYIDTSV